MRLRGNISEFRIYLQSWWGKARLTRLTTANFRYFQRHEGLKSFAETITTLTMVHKYSLNGEERLSDQLKDLNMEEMGVRLREDLLQQCQVLLSELEEFQQYLVKRKKDSGVELRHFKNSVRTEVTSLEKVGT